MARREGSPWTGVNVIARKVFADHLTSLRLGILEGLVFMAALAAVYGASEVLRQTVAESPYVFLHLFTATREPLPSLSEFLGFFVPLVAIGLGFDAVNAELVRGTLSRVLAQPVYRDAFLAGKFLGTLAILFLLLVTLWVLTVGLGIWFLGVPPDGEEMIRLGCFWLVTLLYAGVWLALAVLVSVLITQPASAALVALGIWLFVWLFWPLVAQVLSEIRDSCRAAPQCRSKPTPCGKDWNVWRRRCCTPKPCSPCWFRRCGRSGAYSAASSRARFSETPCRWRKALAWWGHAQRGFSRRFFC